MKRQLKKPLWGTLLLTLFAFALQAQLVVMQAVLQNNFTATKNGKEVGWLRITSSQNGNERTIISESKLAFNVLLSFEATAVVVNKYLGAVLTEAVVRRTMNGKLKMDNALQLSNGTYKVLKGETDHRLTTAIHNTVIALYLTEPVAIKEVFSEVYLVFIPLKKIASSVYETPLPDGGLMTYYYQLGKLVRVIAKTMYGTVQFDLKQ